VLETAPRPTIRTIVASFVFTDLVGFSKGSAADQYAAKARLSSVLRRNLSALRENDYWIKDTGDGALIAFVSNPEHALYMALALAHEYPAGAESGPSSSLRTGLHLGTVKESVDVEARRNFIGDGINAAKRIMDFAQPGQIAASRSFFEAIGNLDAAYAALFQHLGAPDDKHGRAHELYALAASDTVLERLRADLAADSGSAAGEGAVMDSSGAAKRPPAASASGNKRRTLMLAGAAAIALVVAALFVAMPGREPSPPTAISAPPPLPSARDAADVAPPKPSPKREEPATPPKAEAPSAESAGAAAKSVPEASAPAAASSVEPVHNAAVTAPAKAKPPPEIKPRVSASPSASSETRGGTASSSPRCTRILEKAALGEPLAAEEKRELANTCR
jgi:class 3 adenylate cyclase